jgi:ribonuclease J
MINITKPRYFIPMHGTVRHLVLHERIAHSVGIPTDRTFLLMNGNVAELDEASGRILPDRVPAGKVFIDRQSEEVASVVVRDRKHLAEDGFVIVVVALNFNSGDIVREPEIITRGLVHVDASAEMLAEVRELLTDMLVQTGREELGDADAIQEKMRVILKRYFRKKLNRRPMILPVVWEM